MPSQMESKTPDLSEQLAKLAKLHADEALSDEEFAALKAKIIAGVSPSADSRAHILRQLDAEPRDAAQSVNTAARRPETVEDRLPEVDRVTWIELFVPILFVPLLRFFHRRNDADLQRASDRLRKPETTGDGFVLVKDRLRPVGENTEDQLRANPTISKDRSGHQRPMRTFVLVLLAVVVGISALVVIASYIPPATPPKIDLSYDRNGFLSFQVKDAVLVNGDGGALPSWKNLINSWRVYVNEDQQPPCITTWWITNGFMAMASTSCSLPLHVRLVTDRGTLYWTVN